LDWFEEALADLERAERMLALNDYSLTCYLSQQVAEKALKAAIIGLARKRPPRSHDITALYEEVKSFVALPRDVVEELPVLSAFYVIARYPNAGLRRPSRSFTKTQAERAVSVAGAVVEAVRNELAKRDP